MVEGYAWVLGGYPLARVIDGIKKYVCDHADVPTPSDIKKLIAKPQHLQV